MISWGRPSRADIGFTLQVCQEMVNILGPKQSLVISSEPGKGTDISFLIYQHVVQNEALGKDPAKEISMLSSLNGEERPDPNLVRLNVISESNFQEPDTVECEFSTSVASSV